MPKAPKKPLLQIEVGSSYVVLPSRAVHFPMAWGLPTSESAWAVAGHVIKPSNDLEREALQLECHKVKPLTAREADRSAVPVALPPSAHAYVTDQLRKMRGKPGMTPEEQLASEAPKPVAKKKASKKKASKKGGISASAAAAASGGDGGSDEPSEDS